MSLPADFPEEHEFPHETENPEDAEHELHRLSNRDEKMADRWVQEWWKRRAGYMDYLKKGY